MKSHLRRWTCALVLVGAYWMENVPAAPDELVGDSGPLR